MIQLQLESINVCNAACVFCPYPVMKRPKGRMTEELFRKIIDEAATIPAISQVSFQGLGEPLLDRDIVGRIAYTNQVKKGWATTMFTNGHSLTPEMGRRLENAGLSVLYVSINASTAEGRHSVMRLNDYDSVVANVKAVREASKRMKVIPKGVVNMDILSGMEAEGFKELWGPDAFLHQEGNWAGATFQVRRKKTQACGRALGQIMVLWDGRVALCCFDSEGEVIFGDLNKESLKDVYSNPEWVRYREAHWNGNRQGLKLCSGCTDI